MTRVAIAGGTGLAGRHVAAALRAAGHEAVLLSRASGVDVLQRGGLADALDGVAAVIDVLNTPATRPEQTREFFGTSTQNLLAAEQQAGVGRHVLLSIVGVDRIAGNAHYAGKRLQEQLVAAGPVPATIVRATQFYEFPVMVAGWARRDGQTEVPPLLMQPVAVADVAAHLSRAALSPAAGLVELAGPELQDLVDMARRTFAARGEQTRLIPTWRGPFGVEMAGEVLLPGPDAMRGDVTFEQWLAAQRG